MATRQQCSNPFCQDAFQQNDDEANDRVPKSHLDVIAGSNFAVLLEFEQRNQDSAPDEIFTWIDVGEQAKWRV